MVKPKVTLQVLSVLGCIMLVRGSPDYTVSLRFANMLGASKILDCGFENEGMGEYSNTTISDQKYSDYEQVNITKDTVTFKVQIQGEDEMIKSIPFQQEHSNPHYTFFIYYQIEKEGDKPKATFYQRSDKIRVGFSTKTPFDPNLIWRIVDLRQKKYEQTPITLFTRSDGCHSCSWKQREFSYTTHTYLKETSSYGTNIKLIIASPPILQTQEQMGVNSNIENEDKIILFPDQFFKSRGVYTLIVQDDRQFFIVDQEGETYFYALLLIMIFPFLFQIFRSLYLKIKGGNTEIDRRQDSYALTYDSLEQDKTIISGFTREDKPNQTIGGTTRIPSLDALKGAGIVLMIFYKAGGGNFLMFYPSMWNGLTMVDIAEPILIFCVGFSIPYAFSVSQLPAKRMCLIITRTLVMFFLGLIYENRTNSYEKLLLTGFFQRIAVSYFILSMIEFCFPLRFVKKGSIFPVKFSMRLLSMLCFPAVNIAFTYLYQPKSECPAGYQGPGGSDAGGKYVHCTGGAARFIDISVFGDHHLPHHPRCSLIYGCQHFDEYGLLGTLNFIFTGFLGSIAGIIHLRNKGWKKRVTSLFHYLLVLAVPLTICLVLVSWNHHRFMINKSLWSIPFMFFCVFIIVVMLIIIIACIQTKFYLWWPFDKVALNGTFLLFSSLILKDRFPFGFLNSGALMKMSLSNLISSCLWVFVAVILNMYRFYIKF